VVIAVLAVLAIVIETTAILTSFPYGHFDYSDLLGFKLFGVTPWTVAFAWSPLVIGAYAVAARYFDSFWLRVPVIAILLTAFDLVLDPGAVRLGFWRYAESEGFYGVPLSNFAGWLISGAIAGIVLELLVSRFKSILPAPVQLASSTILIVLYWTCVAAFTGLSVPVVIGSIVVIGLASFWLLNYYSFDEMVVLIDDDGNHLGTASKYLIHDAQTPLHKAFSVFLFNEKGELLLQQRAFSKKTWPGVWSNSCCGHQMLHESVENAVRRRLSDELRITRAELHLILPDYRYRAEKDGVVENEICPVFVGFTEQLPRPNRKEVADIRWIPWEETGTVISTANGFSPWAVEELALLKSDPLFHRIAASRIPGLQELRKAA
jgi:isopentenyl-diphosphate delta-isomerase